MTKTFEIIELVGTSTESLSEAIKVALRTGGKENEISWFEVLEQRGRLIDSETIEFQVTLKIGKKNN